MKVVAHDYQSSSWIELELRGELIEAVRPAPGPDRVGPDDSLGRPSVLGHSDERTRGHLVFEPRPFRSSRLRPSSATRQRWERPGFARR